MKISFLNLPTPIIISPKKAGLKQSLPFFMSDEQDLKLLHQKLDIVIPGLTRGSTGSPP